MKNLISVLLFCSGCAPHIVNVTQLVEPELQGYVDLFEHYTSVKYNGGVNFASEDSLSYYKKDAVGICLIYRNDDREIKIDRGYWHIIDSDTKEQLIFHELGHCALDRMHEEDILTITKDGEMHNYPKSIMYPYNFSGEFYNLLKDYYIQELINPENGLTEITL